jgi:23S rRNA pseudouridine1911/1915/1917 synthase
MLISLVTMLTLGKARNGVMVTMLEQMQTFRMPHFLLFLAGSLVAAGIVILHADEDLVAIDKPAGLLSVSTDRQTERTALALVRASLARPGRVVQLWPVHRLDRETSGVLLFARSRASQEAVQDTWNEARKLYLAIVEGRPGPASGVIDQPLSEDRSLNARVGHRPDAKAARTRYITRQTLGKRTLLEVELDTGRRHQIRAHLAWLGHPVVGDPRYGVAGPRLGLHALRLVVTHPSDGRRLTLEAPPPKAFVALLRARSE